MNTKISDTQRLKDEWKVVSGMGNEVLAKGISITVPEDGLKKKLALNRPLNIKLGFDPTAPDLHLGHAVVLNKLRDFQQAGHNIIVIIGDFTAQIGDPTGRNVTRPPLSPEQVKENAETYIAQLSKVLDINKVQVRFNSEWLGAMQMADTVKLMSKFTLAQMMQRNDFNDRYTQGAAISLHELLYPVMQGYDSLVIQADVEIGGTDQLFNCMVGKGLQDSEGKPSQIVVCMPLLRGLDGHEKMSKSKNNYVGLTEDPDNMFGKLMSIPDELITEYLDLATTFDESKISAFKEQLSSNSVNPMEIKKAIAENVVDTYHGKEAGSQARLGFENRVQKKILSDDDYQEVHLTQLGLSESCSFVDLCRAIDPSKSKSEIRRLVAGGGIKLDGSKLSDADQAIPSTSGEFKLQIGKRAFFSVKNP